VTQTAEEIREMKDMAQFKLANFVPNIHTEFCWRNHWFCRELRLLDHIAQLEKLLAQAQEDVKRLNWVLTQPNFLVRFAGQVKGRQRIDRAIAGKE